MSETAEARGHCVFISYSTQDEALARDIVAHVEAGGTRCWLASRDIEAGADWAASINQAIEACSVFLLVHTESSNASGQVPKEIALADGRGIPILQVRTGTVELSDALKYHLATKQWLEIDESFPGADVEKLRRAVDGALGTPVGRAPLRRSRVRQVRRWGGGALAVIVPLVSLFMVWSNRASLAALRNEMASRAGAAADEAGEVARDESSMPRLLASLDDSRAGGATIGRLRELITEARRRKVDEDTPELGLAVAAVQLADGELEEARDQFTPTDLKDLRKRSAEWAISGYRIRAYALDRLGDFRDALVAYETVLEIDPEHVETRWDAAIALRRLGRYDEARERMDQVITALGVSAAPRHRAGARITRGVIRLAERDLTGALADFDDVIRIIKAEDWTGSVELVRCLAICLNDRGLVHFERDDFERASIDYATAYRVLRGIAGDTPTPSIRIVMLVALDNYGDALRCLGEASDAGTDERSAYLADAVDQHTSVLETHVPRLTGEHHVDLRSYEAHAHRNRGMAHGALGDVEAALADLDRAIELYRALLDERRHEEAARDLAVAYGKRGQIWQDHGIATREVASLERSLADFDEAASFLKTQVGATGRDELARMYASQGHVHWRLERWDRAIAAFDAATDLLESGQIGPGDRVDLAEVHALRAVVLFRLWARDRQPRRIDGALAALDRAIELAEEAGKPDLATLYRAGRKDIVEQVAAAGDS